MKNNKDYLVYILITILIVIMVFMIFKIKSNYSELKNKKEKLVNTRADSLKYKNKIIKLDSDYYKKEEKANNDHKSKEEVLNRTLKLLTLNNLELISYNSDREFLILNLRGSFNNILSFLEYIEKDRHILRCNKVKLKKEEKKLYIYLQVKYLNWVD